MKMQFCTRHLLLLITLLCFSIKVTTSEVVSQQNNEDLRSQMDELQQKIYQSEARMQAIQNLKQYNEKNRLLKLLASSGNQESSKLFKFQMNQLSQESSSEVQGLTQPHYQQMIQEIEENAAVAKQQDKTVKRPKDTMLNFIFEKSIIKRDDDISTFELMSIKGFKSATQNMVNTVSVVATKTSEIIVYDLNGHILENLTIANDSSYIISIAQPSIQEEMMFAALTNRHEVIMIKLLIKDVFDTTTLNKTEGPSKKQQAQQPLPLHQTIKLQIDKRINLKELIEKSTNKTIEDDTDFQQIISTRLRGRFIASIRDNKNHLTSLNKDLQLIGRHQLDYESEAIQGLVKQSGNLLFFTRSKIGLARFVDKDVQITNCSTDSQGIVSVAVDSVYPSIIYVSNEKQEIKMIELQNKGNNIECKDKDDLKSYSISSADSFSGNPNQISLDQRNNLLYSLYQEGTLQIFKTGDSVAQQQQELIGTIYKPYDLQVKPTVSDKKLKMSTVNHYVMMELPNQGGLLVIENMYNFKGLEDITSDWSWMRYLTFIIVFAAVGGYQYCKWKSNQKSRPPTKGSMGQQKSANKNSGQFEQMQQMMAEMEALKKKTKQMHSKMGANAGKNEMIHEANQSEEDY